MTGQDHRAIVVAFEEIGLVFQLADAIRDANEVRASLTSSATDVQHATHAVGWHVLRLLERR